MKSERLLWVLHGLLALIFGFYYLGHTVVLNLATPEMLAHFEAHKPYQMRVLMPLLLLVLEKSGLEIVRGTQLITLASASAIGVTFILFLREFVGPKATRLAFLVWPLLFLFFSHRWFYLWDLPSIAFLCLGLWLLQRQKWTIFGIALFFASLNRESSVLLILAFAATYFAPRDPKFWLRVALYSAIWLGVKLGVSVAFVGNRGPNIELHWNDNLAFLTHPAAWPVLVWLSFLTLGAMLLASLLSWRDLPRLLRVSTLLSPLLLAVLLVVGVLSETRLLGETIPLLLPPLCVGLQRLTPRALQDETCRNRRAAT